MKMVLFLADYLSYAKRMIEHLSTNPDRLELMMTFIKIVESKNLSMAARALNTTQPTISRRLKTLELSLGLKLIQRSTHKMQTTEEGQRFYYHAKDIVERWNLIEAEMRGAKTLPTGTLRVQAPHALGIGKFNSILMDYLKNHKKVNIEWLLSDKAPNFSTDNLDCAIKVGNIDDPTLIAIKIFEIPRIIAASKNIVSNSKKILSPSQLQKQTWLAFKNHYFDQVSFFNSVTQEKINIKIEPRFSTDSLLAMRELALRGLGVGVFSKWIIEEDIQNGQLIQLCKDWQAQSIPVYLIYPQSKLKPAKLQKFIELIKAKEELPII